MARAMDNETDGFLNSMEERTRVCYSPNAQFQTLGSGGSSSSNVAAAVVVVAEAAAVVVGDFIHLPECSFLGAAMAPLEILKSLIRSGLCNLVSPGSTYGEILLKATGRHGQ